MRLSAIILGVGGGVFCMLPGLVLAQALGGSGHLTRWTPFIGKDISDTAHLKGELT